MPDGIGQIAEDILRGCLTRDYNERWNIAMVDENAWGVGWGEHQKTVRSLLNSFSMSWEMACYYLY
jgi:hypothetical protein